MSPLAKGLLRSDNLHLVQIKAVLNDAVNEAEGKLSPADLQRVKDEIYRLGTGTYNKVSELEKVAKDFHSQVFEKDFFHIKNVRLCKNKL